MTTAPRYEAKGSNFLRSDHTNYGQPTRVPERGLDWHAAREANPKDQDPYSKEGCLRNLRQSTYKELGNEINEKFPISTTQFYMEQLKQKCDHAERPIKLPMVNESTFCEIVKPRLLDAPSLGFRSVLPHFSPEHDKRYMDTTYCTDYKYGRPYENVGLDVEASDDNSGVTYDNSAVFRKCRSQFTDVDDYHRGGQNTWHDETGVYANTALKHNFFKKTNTIPERL